MDCQDIFCCSATVGHREKADSPWCYANEEDYKTSLVHPSVSLSLIHVLCVCVRTLTGLGMLVCSMDGTVAYLDFSLDELGDPLSEEEKVRHTSWSHMWHLAHRVLFI